MRREAVVDAAAMWGMLAVAFASPARADLRREVQSTTTGAAVTSRPAREKTGVSVCGPIKSFSFCAGTGISLIKVVAQRHSFPGGSDLAIITVHSSVRPCITHAGPNQSASARRHARTIHAKSTLPKQNSLQTARIARARSKTAPPAPRRRRARHSLLRANNCALQLVAWRARLASPRARWKCCNKLTPCTPSRRRRRANSNINALVVVVVARLTCKTARRYN